MAIVWDKGYGPAISQAFKGLYGSMDRMDKLDRQAAADAWLAEKQEQQRAGWARREHDWRLEDRLRAKAEEERQRLTAERIRGEELAGKPTFDPLTGEQVAAASLGQIGTLGDQEWAIDRDNDQFARVFGDNPELRKAGPGSLGFGIDYEQIDPLQRNLAQAYQAAYSPAGDSNIYKNRLLEQQSKEQNMAHSSIVQGLQQEAAQLRLNELQAKEEDRLAAPGIAAEKALAEQRQESNIARIAAAMEQGRPISGEFATGGQGMDEVDMRGTFDRREFDDARIQDPLTWQSVHKNLKSRLDSKAANELMNSYLTEGMKTQEQEDAEAALLEQQQLGKQVELQNVAGQLGLADSMLVRSFDTTPSPHREGWAPRMQEVLGPRALRDQEVADLTRDQGQLMAEARQLGIEQTDVNRMLKAGGDTVSHIAARMEAEKAVKQANVRPTTKRIAAVGQAGVNSLLEAMEVEAIDDNTPLDAQAIKANQSYNNFANNLKNQILMASAEFTKDTTRFDPKSITAAEVDFRSRLNTGISNIEMILVPGVVLPDEGQAVLETQFNRLLTGKISPIEFNSLLSRLSRKYGDVLSLKEGGTELENVIPMGPDEAPLTTTFDVQEVMHGEGSTQLPLIYHPAGMLLMQQEDKTLGKAPPEYMVPGSIASSMEPVRPGYVPPSSRATGRGRVRRRIPSGSADQSSIADSFVGPAAPGPIIPIGSRGVF